MDERATGIILRKRRLTETSLILHWLTRDQGRIATVAKGALRPKSPFRGKLDLFFEGEFSFARSRKTELHALREISLHTTNEGLRREVSRLHQASYCAALVEQVTETETPVPEIHELFQGFLGAIQLQPVRPRNIFAFELKLLRSIGLEPGGSETKLSGETVTLLKDLTELDWQELSGLAATGKQAKEIQQFLHGFLIYHLGKFPEGRPV